MKPKLSWAELLKRIKKANKGVPGWMYEGGKKP